MKELYSLTEHNYIVDSGKIDYLHWVIRSTGDHPCAYIGTNGLWKGEKEEIQAHIPVLLTYDSREVSHLEGLDPELDWLGWDYGHPGDYEAYFEKDLEAWKDEIKNSKKYTYQEIKKDIDWVVKVMLALPFIAANYDLETEDD